MVHLAMLGSFLILIAKGAAELHPAVPPGAEPLPTTWPARLCPVMALLTLFVGIIGTRLELRVDALRLLGAPAHPLFAVLFFGFAAASFMSKVLAAPHARCEVAQCVRRLSSEGYLLLYVVIFVNEIDNLLLAAWRQGNFSGARLLHYLSTPEDALAAQFREQFFGLVGGSLIALLAVRALAACYARVMLSPRGQQRASNAVSV